MLQVNIASLRKLYGSSGKNKKTGQFRYRKMYIPVFELACFVLGDNICYLSEKIQKIILWFGEKP